MLTKEKNFTSTSDATIREALLDFLTDKYEDNSNGRIIEELGVLHGTARIDLAVLNGSIHGYEIKSDQDTLMRLPEQIIAYNSVFDKITLVVGKKHLYESFSLVPDWWGIKIAKIVNPIEKVSFYDIREAESNPCKDKVSVARLLWKEEALEILEKMNKAKGIRSKTKGFLYERLADEMEAEILSAKVIDYLCSRVNWRAEISCMPNGD